MTYDKRFDQPDGEVCDEAAHQPEPHGAPEWLGWLMLVLLFLVAGCVAAVVCAQIVKARGAQAEQVSP